MSTRGLSAGTRVVLTGASTGIGRALAILMAGKYRARMVLNARGQADLDAAAEDVHKAGGEAVTVAGDVADAAVRERLIDVCVESFGGLDVLVNNAGLARTGKMEDLSLEDWRYVFEVNFFAPLDLTYKALPHLRRCERSKVVNIASVAGKISFPGSVCYASSKFALTGLSEGMAAEYAGTGVDVITVCPGWVRTEFFKKNRSIGDPTEIASGSDLKGWLMRNILSISSEDCASDVLKTMEKGGSHEIVLTLPGKMMERLAGVCPAMTQYLATFVPPERKASK